jgi:hypothetical protein
MSATMGLLGESEQLVLPIEPLAPVPAMPGASHQQRFAEFHRLNPWVYHTFCALTRDWLASGHTHAGIGMFTEIVRWKYGRATKGDVFKLNNNHRSRYVRLIEANHPEWVGVFHTRELRSP